MQSKVIFVGGGNMAASLIGGLLAGGHPRENIIVAEPDATRRDWLKNEFNINCIENQESIDGTNDILVLAVKPQVMSAVANDWKNYVQQYKPVVLSIAAGIRTKDLAAWLGDYAAVVRAMPNTPALIQAGATGIYACPEVSAQGREMAESVLRSAGITLWVDDEKLIDSITAISGSGPAYFFLFMEAMQNAGESLGLSEKDARLLTLQTALGAARMALESHEAVGILRQRVTSPGGTTEMALNQFQNEDLSGIVNRAIEAAAQRAETLADELGSS